VIVLFFEEIHTVCNCGYTSVHFCQQYKPKCSLLSISLTDIFLYFLIIVILSGMRWYLTIVSICISLMDNDTGSFILYLLTICVSSLENCLLGSLPLYNCITWVFVVNFLVLYIFYILILHSMNNWQIFSPIL
jgi:hypothetical protein